MSSLLQEITGQGVQGCIAGALFGFVLSTGVAIANFVLLEKEVPLTYCDKRGRTSALKDLNKIVGYNFEPHIRTLFKYRACNPAAYDRACALTQHMIHLHQKFTQARKEGTYAVSFVARFQSSAMAVDARWRAFFTSIETTKDHIGLVEAKTAAAELHKFSESILSEMRDEFLVNSAAVQNDDEAVQRVERKRRQQAAAAAAKTTKITS